MRPSSDADTAPLYDKIKRHILAKVEAREWVPNTQLPSEQRLMEQFGVSRMTVHRALRELTTAGLLVRVPGVGTFISAKIPQSIALELRDISEEIKAAGGQHRAEVVTLESIEVKGEIALELEVRERTHILHSVITHHRDGTPVQLEERFVLPKFAPDYLQQKFTDTTTFAYLWRCSHPTQVEHYIYAMMPTKRLCTLLEIEPSEPCTLLTRRTWVGPTVATYSRFYYPASRYRLKDTHKYSLT